ncbi:MAG TPA: hypothetical protein VML55_01865 [Planctomycetaceae bacterium]|nr:hypothetical protein [Planctomycetaceae bacterium]
MRLLAEIDTEEKSIAARRAVSLLGWLGTPRADRLLKELADEDPNEVAGRSAAALIRK